MNIFEFAMQMEQDGEKYYQDLAKGCRTDGLRKIFLMLADEEAKHFSFVEQLSNRLGDHRFSESALLDQVKNIFMEMKNSQYPLHHSSTSEIDAYRFACNLERKSLDFYKEKAGKATAAPQFQLFLQLAREEAKHLRIMENIVEFVSRPEPGNWLENAEWTHLDEY
jgi:rubrerythrin